MVPWLPPLKGKSPAVVDLENCNGCARCADDCPFGAITMEPRSDGKAYEIEAVVDPALCMSCGLCTWLLSNSNAVSSALGAVAGHRYAGSQCSVIA